MVGENPGSRKTAAEVLIELNNYWKASIMNSQRSKIKLINYNLDGVVQIKQTITSK
jgi:hypothetical protein